jgi:hypothetical protein
MDRMIKKVFFAWQLEKEKAFLEEKAKEGLLLKKVGFFRYYFEESDSRDVVYQFDFQIIQRKNEEEYLSLYQDWELVDRYGSWYYFRKDNDGKTTEIFNDIDSKRKMFLRLLGILFLIGFPLYYQTIILFPSIIVQEGELGTFYSVFRVFAFMLMILHIFASFRILIYYLSLKNNISE